MGGTREVKVARVQQQDLDCSRQAMGGGVPLNAAQTDWLAGWSEAAEWDVGVILFAVSPRGQQPSPETQTAAER